VPSQAFNEKSTSSVGVGIIFLEEPSFLTTHDPVIGIYNYSSNNSNFVLHVNQLISQVSERDLVDGQPACQHRLPESRTAH